MLKRSALALAVLVAAAVPAFASGPFDWHGGWHIGPQGGFLLLVLLAGALALVVFGLIRVFSRGDSRQVVATAAPAPVAQAPSSAFAILAERFARGEIDPVDYDARRRILAGDVPPSPAPPTTPAA